MQGDLRIAVPATGFDRAAAIEAVRAAGLDTYLSNAAAGPFGHTSRTLAVLEAAVDAIDLGLAAVDRLRGAVLEDLRGASTGSFALPRLEDVHRQLLSTFQIVVTSDAFLRRAESICPAPAVEGGLDLDGLLDLLRADVPDVEVVRKLFALGRAFGERQTGAVAAGVGSDRAVQALLAFVTLLRAAVLELGASSAMRPLVGALEGRQVEVAGHRYRGLAIREIRHEPSGLLPVGVEDIVGNDEYLQAGLRLARDVAGFDLQARRNPKRFSPVLFGLGRPGCGKTVTAHAIGNAFLEHCERHDVPARFHVVRRTDWASSYQNASARNLVRFFREEVHAAEGVAGVYWPDIDTAFASRDSGQLRSEEKQNLGAVFGIFDGTLLPRDGSWFLICDANTLHMDEATISRIAQNPFRVEGPKTDEQYVRLMRDVLLRDVSAFLPSSEDKWRRIGALARELDLSGRNIESVCSNVRATIQDYEYPDEYYRASSEERERIVASLGRPVDAAGLERFLRDFSKFRDEADREAEQERFDGEVERIVRHLNASRAAAERLESAAPPGR